MSLVVALCCLGAPAQALEADRDPLDVPLRQYVFLLAVAMLGGVVSWAAKVRAGSLHAFNLSALIGELATSAFAGLLTFWLCSYVAAPQSLTAALVGIAGHMGTRAINQLEQWLQNRITPSHL
jgi:hypothetical protein